MTRLLSIIFVVILVVVCLFVPAINGHGMLLDPPGRSSRWRYDSTAPVNYNDNALYCGGFAVQWYTHGGKCGLCGDNYGLPQPRPNELGGTYGGTGVITKAYTAGSVITAGVQISANHLGYLWFDLCNLDKFGVESEDCFAEHRLLFADGSDKNYIGKTTGYIESPVVLPFGLSCEHCILRWTYTAGNNWGTCEDGTGAMGCGPQEHFRSCSDIRISVSRSLFSSISSDPVVPMEVDEDLNV